MFRIHRSTDAAVPTCLAAPARFHVQVRTAHRPDDIPFRLEVRDSAMPARFHIA
ncbi:hypothetical protein LUTEI9C_100198 [Luteimonas sp. 9C]|uniref:hypothetical protein n=1 Tax=Luteimonas sp. 9C TaxID=2653148 RepID=UPI0012EFD559|nr:hypothetical protein [Luteimonas sp. 9C]VXB12638.1 hypothetical protein LUTEI9C_100198 [Luteimonas sp. 9C]